MDEAVIEAARRGDWEVVLTPSRPVPRAWFGDVVGRRILCLASGGGQQAPVLAAAGAVVTSLDASDSQLEKDAAVAEREGLPIRTVQGDMADLTCFEDESFDRVFHPVSNVFAADVRPVWRECARVLAPSGRLLAGFLNPALYLIDHAQADAGGPLEVRFPLPYADTESLPSDALERRVAAGEPLEFGHTLTQQIGGQIEAGFAILGFYEDHLDVNVSRLDAFMPSVLATLAEKRHLEGRP